VIRLSIPVRQALAKLTLPVLIAAAFGLMLLGKADALLAERARMALADALAPGFGVLAEPMATVRAGMDNARDMLSVRGKREAARGERTPAPMAGGRAVAGCRERHAEIQPPLVEPAPSYITARVVADAGASMRACCCRLGPITASPAGRSRSTIVGWWTGDGNRARSARVLLLTDLNSRIPVILETSRARAMLVGTNGPRPRLMHWPEGMIPAEGERIVTSTEANAFPAGLPLGTVHYTASNVPEVEPVARLDRLEIVRLFDYGRKAWSRRRC
jgi:rod shape-determining protein MreC